MNKTTEPRAVKITCTEAARKIGVSPRTLEAWRRDRRGPAFFRPKPGRPFYLESDIDDWLAASKVRTYAV
jgi:transposase-like protein